MFIELSQIPEEGLDLLYEDEIREGSEGLWEPCSPVRASIHLERREEGVLASGIFSTVVSLSCSRCSESFVMPVEDTFEVYFMPPSSGLDAEVELSAGELDVEFLKEGRIDILSLIRESILLSLPVQPLCREDCRGLCVRCGANLNEAPCNCPERELDPRLALLKKLL